MNIVFDNIVELLEESTQSSIRLLSSVSTKVIVAHRVRAVVNNSIADIWDEVKRQTCNKHQKMILLKELIK